MNESLQELHGDVLAGIAGGNTSIGVVLAPVELRPPPFPYFDIRFKPQPDPWRIALPGG